MELQDIVTQLRRVSLFEDLDDERGEMALYQVAKIVNEATYNAGEWLFGQGYDSDRLYIVIGGRIQLNRVDPEGVTHELGVREVGQVFGQTGLLVGDYHDATAVALIETHVLYILRDEFRAIYDDSAFLRRKLKIRPEVTRRLNLPDFKWLRGDEFMIFAEQRHWAQLMRKAFPPLLMFLILLPIFALLLSSSSMIGMVGAIVLAVPLIVLMGLVGWQYFNWRDDFFVLTTQRVVHIERVWPFKEHFEESALDNIEDLYEVRAGLAANVLNFGNLVLQTAGETVEIDMDFISNPSYLNNLISREIERARARDMLHSLGAIRDELAQRLNIKSMNAPEPEPVPEPTPNPNIAQLIFGSIWDYFFPPAWVVSPDGDTIMWRRFWLPGFISYLQVFVPLALVTLGGGYFLLLNWEAPTFTWFFIGWLLVEAALFGFLLWFIEDWRNDYFQLTPHRIVLVQRKPLLLQESRREAPLDRIQNISFEVPGVLGQMFHYGHVTLETAGTTGKFELRWVRDPQRVQSEISQQQRQYIEREKQAEAQRRREEFLSWFATYDALSKATQSPSQPSEPASASDATG